MREDGQRRVVIENVRPAVDGGLFPVKRVVGEKVRVTADVFADGHDSLKAVLLYRREEENAWTEVPMRLLGNDLWEASFVVEGLCGYVYTVSAWVDRFVSWRETVRKKHEAEQDVGVELAAGAKLVDEAAARATAEDAKRLKRYAEMLRSAGAEDPEVPVYACADRSNAVTCDKQYHVSVDRPRALFSAWYELFPRSCKPGGHGTLRDCVDMLPEIAAMGFDVLYLPPIHPIGTTNRKGRNNSPAAKRGEPGSPWAIGSTEGGHTAVNPALGTTDDLERLVAACVDHGMELAIDIALQCSPDHPYVKQHPEWFRWRPDGSIQFAENPPKKYEDVVPLDFETPAWRDLWEEMRNVIVLWAGKGVRIFRVDNPHTKPFVFWEWLIAEVRQRYPDVLFLAEAFTRPKVMYRLAKAGFSQSYTYFTWRNTKHELTTYLTELTKSDVREFFRPNFWPNTPDILPEVSRVSFLPPRFRPTTGSTARRSSCA
jgi:starch synthase (maltosyl-transferring)